MQRYVMPSESTIINLLTKWVEQFNQKLNRSWTSTIPCPHCRKYKFSARYCKHGKYKGLSMVCGVFDADCRLIKCCSRAQIAESLCQYFGVKNEYIDVPVYDYPDVRILQYKDD